MNTDEVIILARKHVGNGALMQTSAVVCLADAIEMRDAGNLEAAKKWAVRSLAYSVGILHADHQKAVAT